MPHLINKHGVLVNVRRCDLADLDKPTRAEMWEHRDSEGNVVRRGFRRPTAEEIATLLAKQGEDSAKQAEAQARLDAGQTKSVTKVDLGDLGTVLKQLLPAKRGKRDDA